MLRHLAWLLVPVLGAAEPIPSGRSTLAMVVDGWARSAELVVPSSTAPAPLVIVLHGAGGSGAGYLDRNGWIALSASVGCVVAAPDGLPSAPGKTPAFRTNPRLWNSGQLRPGSARTAIDDVAFLRALVDRIAAARAVDRGRVLVAGHSNGAGMAWRLAAEAPDLVTAVAAVCGPMPVADPRPARGVPVWAIHGAVDPIQPLAGGESTLPWGVRTTPPPEEGLRRWVAAIGAPATAATVPEPAGLRTRLWGPGRDGATLRWTIIAGHGHPWPGGKDSGLPASVMGPESGTMDATTAIWSWFTTLDRRTGPP